MQYDDLDRFRILSEARNNLERLAGLEDRMIADREARIYRRDALESWSDLQPEPEPPRRPQLDTTPRAEDPWADWNRWADNKIANALASHRQSIRAEMQASFEGLSEAVVDLITQERKAMRNNLADQIKELRLEVTALEGTLEELRRCLRSQDAKVIDLPNPMRRAN
jgi:hypothetical protein